MEFIGIPTEQTTAVTDAILGLLSLGITLYFYQFRRGRDPLKVNIWVWAFGLLAFASIVGAAAHGLKLPPAVYVFLWQPINLALGLTIAFFVVGVVYDLWGQLAAKRAMPFLLGAGLIFYGLTVLFTGTFLVFIAYEALAMLFALGGYAWLAARNRLAGAGLMALGVLITIIAAAVQASGAVRFTLIWPFDFNGAFHLIQMVGVFFLAAGLRTALLLNQKQA